MTARTTLRSVKKIFMPNGPWLFAPAPARAEPEYYSYHAASLRAVMAAAMEVTMTESQDEFGGRQPAGDTDQFGGPEPADDTDQFGGPEPADDTDQFGGPEPADDTDQFGGPEPADDTDQFGGRQ